MHTYLHTYIHAYIHPRTHVRTLWIIGLLFYGSFGLTICNSDIHRLYTLQELTTRVIKRRKIEREAHTDTEREREREGERDRQRQ